MSSNEENIHNFMSNMCWFGGLFGLTFVENRNRHLEKLRSIVAMILFVVTVYLLERGMSTLYTQEHVFFNIHNMILLLAVHGYACAPFTFVVQYKRGKSKLAGLTRQLARICRANYLLEDSLYRPLHRFVLLIYFCFFLTLLMNIIDMMNNQNYTLGLIQYIGVTILQVWIFVPVMQFLCWNLLLHCLFVQMKNLLLQSLLPLQTTNNINADMANKFCSRRLVVLKMKARRLLRSFKILLRAKNRVTGVYGLLLVFFLWCNTANLVFNSYVIIEYYSKRIVSYVQLFITLAWLFSIFRSSENVDKLMRSCTTQLLNNTVKSEQHSLFDKQIRNISLTSCDSRHSYRICNLFNLDYKTFLSVISFTIAYIILQLQLNIRN